MKNRKLIITWKPDVLNMYEHKGSKAKNPENDYYKGKSARSERDSFNNIKSLEAAEKILSKRNKSEMIFAEWNGEIIYTKPKVKVVEY